MSYGIKDITKVSKNEEIVCCINCDKQFYDEITDERNNNSLKLFFDTDHFFKGCPVCETDKYLIDLVA